jgi:hypothetical protein
MPGELPPRNWEVGAPLVWRVAGLNGVLGGFGVLGVLLAANREIGVPGRIWANGSAASFYLWTDSWLFFGQSAVFEEVL